MTHRIRTFSAEQMVSPDARPSVDPGVTRWVWLALVFAVAVSLASCGFLDRPEPPPLVQQEEDLPSIAVLPLKNLGDPEDTFLADGMAKAVTTRLAAVHGLSVISRSKSVPTERNSQTAREVGIQLGVDFVLDGDFLRDDSTGSGERLQIQIRLMKIGQELPLWIVSFEQPVDEVFTIQTDIANGTVDSIGVVPSNAERAALGYHSTNDLPAYLEYLHGLTYSWSFEEAELELAEHHFSAAIELDPSFAAAHALLSETHSQMFHFRYDRSPQRLASAIAAARRALEIDGELPEGHRALGYYYYWCQKNYERALADFAAAAGRRPNDPLIVSGIGFVLRRQGRWEEALAAFERAVEMDPESDGNVVEVALTCGRMRRYAEGIEHCRRAIQLAPDDAFPYVYSARMHRSWSGSTDNAREILESMPAGENSLHSIYWYEQALFERDFATARRHLENTEVEISELIDEAIMPRSLAVCELSVLQGTEAVNDSSCLEALEYLERRRNDSPVDPAVNAALGWTYALFGRKEDAIEAGQRAYELLPIEDDAMAGHSNLIRMAKIFAWVDEPYKAVKTIEKALTFPGWISPATLRLDPEWDPIRDDPRFKELLKIHGTTE